MARFSDVYWNYNGLIGPAPGTLSERDRHFSTIASPPRGHFSGCVKAIKTKKVPPSSPDFKAVSPWQTLSFQSPRISCSWLSWDVFEVNIH